MIQFSGLWAKRSGVQVLCIVCFSNKSGARVDRFYCNAADRHQNAQCLLIVRQKNYHLFLGSRCYTTPSFFVQSKPQRGSQKKSGKRIHLGWDVKKSFVFLGWDVKMSFVFLDWDVKRRHRISLSLARRLPTPCSSNKRPDNLFLHSLVYWSSLGRPRHLNKSTNTQIQQKHSPVKWSYSFLPIRRRHLQRHNIQKRRKLTNF